MMTTINRTLIAVLLGVNLLALTAARATRDVSESEGSIFAEEALDYAADTLNIAPQEIGRFMKVVDFNTTKRFITMLTQDLAIRLLEAVDRIDRISENDLKIAIARF